jgi:shikimate 5-dehydrogenase
MYFIGVTTAQSSIMKVFPRWAEELRLNAVLRGIDFVPNDRPERYREAVAFIKRDEKSLGALVTTHKINLLEASRDLFDELDPYAQTLGEISSISKRSGALVGHAKDPITAGYGLEAIVDEGYWKRTGAAMLILGSGGSSLALTLFLHEKQRAGGDVPKKIVVTARREAKLAEMRELHHRIGFAIPIDYRVAETPEKADAIVSTLPVRSMVINATGLGKDAPGSPLTDAVRFPEHSIAWEFNYRGDLVFLQQAKAKQAASHMQVEDGWFYFIHGWTRVVAEVFDIDIPTSGPGFERLSQLAIEATKRS